MAVTIEKLRCVKHSVRWKTRLPRVNWGTDSFWFKLEGEEWGFSIERTFVQDPKDETWTLSLRRRHTTDPWLKFLLTLHVIGRFDQFVFLNQKTIEVGNTELWSISLSKLSSTYPQVDFESGLIAFVFTFDFGFRDVKKINTDCKSVQTSPYLDDRPCLEQLSKDLRKLMEEGSEADVQMRCGDTIHLAHSLVLGARSEVFRIMLESDMQERRERLIEIVDMEPAIFELFYRFLYTGILPEMTEEIVWPLYEAGDKYGVEALRRRCGDFLAENLTPDNACGILAMADAHSDKDLKERVLTYVLNEEVPGEAEKWSKFTENHPKLANEVLYRAYRQFICSA